MTLTLELTPQQEHYLKSLAEQKKLPVESIVDRLLTTVSADIDDEQDDEFDAMWAEIQSCNGQPTEEDLDEMFAAFDAIMPSDIPPLPADFSRADIYMDHD